MASKPDYSPPEDLTRCGICKEIINKPKSLLCLHTFCLKCLREWSNSSSKSVTCPILACKKTTPMPSDGVDGLPGNVFVSSLIEKSIASCVSQDLCACCEETQNVVLARCLDCNGFLCQKGVDMHQTPLLKDHQTIKLDDIKSGKVDLSKLTSTKRPTCSEHEGQLLWFFCETCKILICRDCTVVNHRNPKHKYEELKNVIADQRKKIQYLITESEPVMDKVSLGIKNTADTRERVVDSVKRASAEIDKAVEMIKTHVDKVCLAEKERLTKENSQYEVKSSQTITSAEAVLQSQKCGLQMALDMANQILLTGSDYDVASVYKQLSTSFEELRKITPENVLKPIEELPIFDSTSQLVTTEFATIRMGMSFESWVLEREFGRPLLNVRSGISTTPTGEIAVAQWSTGHPVKVYSHDGQFKFDLDERSQDNYNVAVSSTGHFYVAQNSCRYILVHGSDGRFLSQFNVTNTVGALRGLAINDKNQVLVGDIGHKCIEIHNLDGKYITTIRVSIQPFYIATTPQGNIVVSGNECVQVLDSKGTLKHTINAPNYVSQWRPEGVCCSMNGEICISNSGEPKGIYCFSSTTGVYLGCITRETEDPKGIALTRNDEKLVVVDKAGNCVKMFRRK